MDSSPGTLRLGLGSRKKDSMYKSVRLETQTAEGKPIYGRVRRSWVEVGVCLAQKLGLQTTDVGSLGKKVEAEE